MFGYITADKPELRVKEYHQYRGYYCGLCQAMAEYGQGGRILLSYDCVFLYILLSALQETPLKMVRKKCIAHPARKELMIFDAPAEYAAAVNVLLGAFNLRDKKQDRQQKGAGAALLVVRRAEKKARQKYPLLAESMQKNLQVLAQVEQAGETDIDRAAHPFAQLLGEIFSGLSSEEGQKKVLWELGYQLGRWIYLADAWEDRREDQKKGNYNVFLKKFAELEAQAAETAEFNLKSAVNAAVLAYDLLDVKRNQGILENIMYRGIPRKTEAILRGEKENRRHGSL